MDPYRKLTGIVAPLDRVDVDTDQITPKQFLKGTNKKGLGKVVFHDWRFDEAGKPRPDFVLNQPRYQGATILLARRNFGCGSSREHSPWALLDYGFRTILCESFADIFYTNCFKNGILPIALPPDLIDELFRKVERTPGCRLTVDLEKQALSDDAGWTYPFPIERFRKKRLLEGADEIELALRQESRVRAYEERIPSFRLPA
jgi:3-isopropylmalate/(R)-2-methylmalate dehydratase small subunit